MAEHPSPDELVGNLVGMPDRAKETPRRWFSLWMAIGVIALVLIVGGILFYLFNPLGAPVPDDVGAQYAGLERSTTDQGFPRLGHAGAPVIVEDFSSFACSHCRAFSDERLAGLLDEIAAGQVQFVFIPVPHIGWGAETAARGALCAGEQDRFWEMHDVLFYWQSRFFASVFSERRIRAGAKNLGLDVVAFDKCMDDNHPAAVIELARSEFERRHLVGTPSLFINGQKVQDYREFDTLGELAEGPGAEEP